MQARRLLLWRHGRTAWNAERRFQGHSDVPLDSVGIAEAAAAAVLLSEEKPDLIVSSDLTRAMVTAQALADVTGLPIRTDVRLRESSLGRWEGRTRADVEREFPGEWQQWVSGSLARRGGGELHSEVADRAQAAAADADGQTVVLVTHGGTAKLLAARLLGLPPPLSRVIAPLANCHWSDLRLEPAGWRLDRHNVGPFPEHEPVSSSVDAEEPEEAEEEIPVPPDAEAGVDRSGR
ncbi:MAG: histidine phosphatase family protein [Geodermatophilaceae bacterium]